MCVFLDVDTPQDLSATNVLTDSAQLTWRPPRADITGYILSFQSTDGTIRVGGAWGGGRGFLEWEGVCKSGRESVRVRGVSLIGRSLFDWEEFVRVGGVCYGGRSLLGWEESV